MSVTHPLAVDFQTKCWIERPASNITIEEWVNGADDMILNESQVYHGVNSLISNAYKKVDVDESSIFYLYLDDETLAVDTYINHV